MELKLNYQLESNELQALKKQVADAGAGEALMLMLVLADFSKQVKQ